MTEGSTTEHRESPPQPERWTPAQKRLLAVVAAAAGISGIDTTIVNVALPHIGSDLTISLAGLQWVVDAYSLLYGAFLLTAGVLADRYGHRRVFTIGVLAFALASTAIAASQGSSALIVARAFQGISAAALTSAGMAQLTAGFPGPARARALGLYTTVASLSFVIGPLLGGVLVDSAGWRWAFLINLPLCLAVVAASRGLPGGRRSAERPLDPAGLLLSAGGLLAVTYAVIAAPEHGWGSPTTIGGLAGGAVLLTLFVVTQRRGHHPLLDLRILRSPAYSGALLTLFAIVASFFGLMMFLAMWFQQVRGYSALAAGAALLPIILPFMVTAPMGAKLLKKFGTATVTAVGSAVTAVGLLPLTMLDSDTGWLLLTPALVILGAGGGVVQAPVMAAALGAVAPERAGLASGVANSVRPLGIVVGVAALGTVLAAQVRSALEGPLTTAHVGADHAEKIIHTVSAGRIETTLGVPLHTLQGAFTSGLTAVAWGSVALAVCAAAIAALTLRSKPGQQLAGAPAPHEG
ncbi:MFS transporter [Streptomyces sp. NPDC020883]|uniref:MFS transporter n=1 Tax=Streptomyces sp. NPDC020883 TaxID=3365099 RepID=UPI00378B1715